MSLGERIYKLRTEKNLSQDALAEMLEVSRQSVSKWENNNTVPDLEKLLKLSEIFGISLDELMKGEKTVYDAHKGIETAKAEPPKTEVSNRKVSEVEKSMWEDFPLKKVTGIIGIIILCRALIPFLMQLLGGFFSFPTLLMYSPYLALGGICLAYARKRDDK